MKLYRTGDGTPQLIPQMNLEHEYSSFPKRTNPTPPCIVLEDHETSILANREHADHPALTEAVRLAAFDLLREHPEAYQVRAVNGSAHTFQRHSQAERLSRDLGITLATGGGTIISEDYLREDDILWTFAFHATIREASDLLDSYNALINPQVPAANFDPRYLHTAREIVRKLREHGGAPPTPTFPAATTMPPASEMKVATVSEITLITPSSTSLARDFAVGMYMIVPADFPDRCQLSVSPVLAWASFRDEGGQAHHFITGPAETVNEAWVNFDIIREGTPRLPDPLVRVEGELLRSQRTLDFEDESLPFFFNTCDKCRYTGCRIEDDERTDFYFCTKRAVPKVIARYGSQTAQIYEAPYHEARTGNAFSQHAASHAVATSAEKAQLMGLTTEYDQPPGSINNLPIPNAAADPDTLRCSLQMLLSAGITERDFIIVETPVEAVATCNMLEQLALESGIRVVYQHPNLGARLFFESGHPLENSSTSLIASVDNEHLLVQVEGLGLRIVEADDAQDEGHRWHNLESYSLHARKRSTQTVTS